MRQFIEHPWLIEWRRIVHIQLRLGFGVEDIARTLKKKQLPHCTAREVREEVERLRAEGRLMEVLGKPSGASE